MEYSTSESNNWLNLCYVSICKPLQLKTKERGGGDKKKKPKIELMDATISEGIDLLKPPAICWNWNLNHTN